MSATLTCDGAGQMKRADENALRASRLESLGMLASGIAHDLNNVLSPIVLAAPILREHATNPDDLRIIASLEKSAERGVDLVRQILSFAHGAASVPQPVDLKHLLQETVSVAAETFPKNIRVVDNFPGNLWPIMADPTQIHQVLLNLCINARDAMPDGGTLYLTAENTLLDETMARKIPGGRPGAWIVLHVEDSGTGIPHDALAHIFEPFFTTKEAGKGTGIGLSTVPAAAPRSASICPRRMSPPARRASPQPSPRERAVRGSSFLSWTTSRRYATSRPRCSRATGTGCSRRATARRRWRSSQRAAPRSNW